MEVEFEQVNIPVQDSLPNSNEDVNFEKWSKQIQTRVKALKIHIMASKGLTANGDIGKPYSPYRILQNDDDIKNLSEKEKKELELYIEAAMSRITVNTVEKSQSESAVVLDDVQFTIDLEDNNSNSEINKDETDFELPIEKLENHISTVDSRKTSFNDSVNCNMKEINDTILKQAKEIEKLSKIREDVENELQDLTANLFQEAHIMVLGANQRAAAAEKSLKEANMQVEVLQAEVAALKTLVITSTPSTPNPHLHPQLFSRGAQAIAEAGKMFQRGHKKSPSDFDLKYGRETTPPSSPLKDSKLFGSAGSSEGFPVDQECWEVDPVLHKEFVFWRQNPIVSRDDPFMNRIYSEDIDLCLTFPNSMLGHKVQTAIEENALYIEEVNPRQKSSCPKKCVLLDVPRYCKYRFRLGDKDETWYYISHLARNRIIGVCDFLNYLRYIQLGLVKSSIHDVYWEIVKRRRQMSMARLGL